MPEDRVDASDRSFCRACYETLRRDLEDAVERMSSDVDYPRAVLGAVLGGLAGALLWWGFTVVTHISFGLVAVAIGYLVGTAVVRFSGGKRSTGLQAVAVTVSVASFVVATYLVNRTFVNRALETRGDAFRVGVLPQSPQVFASVVRSNFGIMDVVFLAIAIYQAWKITKPLRLAPIPPPA